MPPEIEDLSPKAEPAVPAEPLLIDYFSFHQNAITGANDSNSKGQQASIEFSNPYAYHQGLDSLAKVLNKPQANAGSPSESAGNTEQKAGPDSAARPDNVICVDGRCRPMTQAEIEAFQNKIKPGQTKQIDLNSPFNFDWHQKGDGTPGKPEPFNKPGTDQTQPPKPQDKITDQPPANIPDSKSGKSSIVEAYERRQGARNAGSGYLPPIDAIPNDLRPPSPGTNPGPGPSDLRPPSPGPDLPPWTPPKDNNVKPTDFTPKPNDQIENIKPKYETDEIGEAVRLAKETGLPLAVHIGASWCHYCVEMERNTWPAVEGSNGRKGSMQGKVVVLHLDVDDAKSLRGEDARYASEILKNRGSSIPIIRMFSVDQSGSFSKTNENRGAINSRSQLESFLIRGGAKR